jgi:lycopene beta-cyclase
VRADVLLVGGGLANGLVALRLRARRPELRVVLVEREARLGGSHTWSFHSGDLDDAQRAWLAPLLTCSWPRYDVRFPGLERRIEGGYHSLTSESLEPALSRALGAAALLGSGARDVRPDGATLDDGREVEARCVIDGRGLSPVRFMNAAYQKFLGLEVELLSEHGLEAPLLMDATVRQEGGFRFVYALPLGPRTALIEDTCYAEDPGLEPATLRERIGSWAETRGWAIARVGREESGVLPIPLEGDVSALWAALPAGVPCSGVRAGLFHATTGYSLPQAARLADRIAARPALDSAGLHALVRAQSEEWWRSQGFFRLLNRMLFRAAEPSERWRVLERFYRLPEPLIHRFYAGRLTFLDRARILSGRPPVPLLHAARAVRERRVVVGAGATGVGDGVGGRG